MPMPLPRSTALRVLRERALPTVRIRTLSTTPTATASHAAPDTTTTTAADGTWKFVAGKRILITPGSIRTRFESKERKLLADRELATAPQPDVVVPSVSSTTLTEGMSDDVDEGIGMAGLDSSGEGAEPFAGYQRLQKGDLCELR